MSAQAANSDDASSTASFENVSSGGPLGQALTVRRSGQTGETGDKVPDVLYTVKYCNANGRILETRESDKPLDIDRSGPRGEANKTPVIEISTRVCVVPGGNQRAFRAHPPMPPYNRSPSYSSESDDDYHQPPPVPRGRHEDVRVEKKEVVIHSKHLIAALTAVVAYYPGFIINMGSLTVDAPYEVLFHHWKDLESYKVNQPACHDAEYMETTKKHIDILLSFLKTQIGETVAAEERRWSNTQGPVATFTNFWMLARPGEIVYKEEHGHLVAYVLSSCWRVSNSDGNQGEYEVHHWNIRYRGGRLYLRYKSTRIDSWNGERAIDTLPLIPARFLPGGAKAMADKQTKLGQLYWELTKQPSYWEYDGPLIAKDGGRGGNLTGRVIIDCEGFERFKEPSNGYGRPPHHPRRPNHPPPGGSALPQLLPRCPCQACLKADQPRQATPFAGFEGLDPSKSELPANVDFYYHVLEDTMPAFILGERRWNHVKIAYLGDVTPDREAFKYLVLDNDVKLTVKALIGKFASSDGKLSPWPSDFVKNKGEGRIFLLHGSPGVGKTCTAECVAELTRRPLLSLTSGDINTSMGTNFVESRLNYFLSLGERFGALVLLDEADVFLEARRTRDLDRNGLVSIFLRALEYYRGVLFLTTNRVEAFDSAFTSRIHVALHYKKLRDSDRQRIWIQNFERLGKQEINTPFIRPPFPSPPFPLVYHAHLLTHLPCR